MLQKCPICESENVEVRTSIEQLALPYCESKEYKIEEIYCPECDEITCESDENEKNMELALINGKMESVDNILNYLSQHNISNAYIERALDLPVRTVARWKQGKFSASSLALLRMIRSFNWLIDVAEANYDESAAQSIMLEKSVKLLIEKFAKDKDVQLFKRKMEQGVAAGAIAHDSKNKTTNSIVMLRSEGAPDGIIASKDDTISSFSSFGCVDFDSKSSLALEY